MDNSKVLKQNGFIRTKSIIKKNLNNKVFLTFFLVVLSFIVGEIITPGFASFNHVLNVVQTSFFLGLIVLGETIVIISGKEGIDLSVGAIFTMGVVVSAILVNENDANIIMAFFVVLILGFVLGLVNGIGISFLGIAPLIMTLGWGIAVEGIAYFSTGGFLPGGASPLLERISGKSIIMNIGHSEFFIPWLVVIWIVIIAVVSFILRKTRTGFILYATGANENTAVLVGVRTKVVRLVAYGISGLFAALSGMFMLGYVGTPNLGLGERYILPAVVAAIIGGVNLTGGAGTYLGAAAGAIFLTSLLSILTILGFGESLRQMIVGIVLLIMLTFYSRNQK